MARSGHRLGLALSLFVVGLASCERTEHSAPAPSASALPAGELRPGARVLTPFGRSIYFEGEVAEVKSGTVTTKKRLGKSERFLKSQVIVLPAVPETAPLAAGNAVIARVDRDMWQATTVLRVEGDMYVVDTKKKHRLARRDVLAAPAGVSERLNKLETGRALEKEAQRLVPYRPKGYRPKRGSVVLYRTDFDGGRWWEGKVTRVEGDVVRVTSPVHRLDEWYGQLEIAPLPSDATPKPKRGDLVLVRPESRDWQFGRVEAVDGQTVDVRLSGGQRRPVAESDLVPLVARRDAELPPLDPKRANLRTRSVALRELLSELGVNRFEFLPHADGTIKFLGAGGKKLAEARYQVILSYGPWRKYTMGYAVSAFQGKFPVVPRQAGKHEDVVNDVLRDAAFERAVAVGKQVEAEFVYVASTLYVALSGLTLRLDQAKLDQLDLSSRSRAVIAAVSEAKSESDEPKRK